MGSLSRIGLLATEQAAAVTSAAAPTAMLVPSAATTPSPALVYLARLAPGSRPAIRSALEIAARFVSSGRVGALDFPWAALGYQHVQTLRAHIADKFAAATANRVLAATRGVTREAFRMGLLSGETYERVRSVEGVRHSTLPRGRGLDGGELHALFRACAADRSARGARDAAIVAVGYAGGLRRAEVVGLDVADLDLDTGAVVVRAGKGNKARRVFVAAGAVDALRAWLKFLEGGDGPLFVAVDKAGKLQPRRLTGQSVALVLRRRVHEASIAPVTPHDLRRSCASDLLDRGADLSTVQKILGHASPQTSARYDRRPDEARRRAAGLLHIPSVSRP